MVIIRITPKGTKGSSNKSWYERLLYLLWDINKKFVFVLCPKIVKHNYTWETIDDV